MRPKIALLDANVLYSAPLRDTLVTLGVFGVYSPRWTAQIHEEWIGNLLLNRPDLTRRDLERTRDLMDFHLPDALVSEHESLVEQLSLPDANDRHVLAMAIRGGAQVLVTFNSKDFPRHELERWNLVAQNPDEFLVSLLRADAAQVTRALANQRARLKHPPLSVAQFLANLKLQRLPRFAARSNRLAMICRFTPRDFPFVSGAARNRAANSPAIRRRAVRFSRAVARRRA